MDTKQELLQVLLELAAVDRDAYREVRSEAWARVVRNHQRKTPEQLDKWNRGAS